MLDSVRLEPDEEDSIPSVVLAAMGRDFGGQITGYLCAVQIDRHSITGIVFRDRYCRFRDGAHIRTSTLIGAELIDGYVVVDTLNSRYVVCDFLPTEEPLRPGQPLH